LNARLFGQKRRSPWTALAPIASGLHYEHMSKVEQIESELRKLSQTELRQIRGWLDDVIEGELELLLSSNVPSSDRNKRSLKEKAPG